MDSFSFTFSRYRFHFYKDLIAIKVDDGRDSSVGIATGYRLGQRDLIPARGKIFFLASRLALEFTQPPIQH
jgi:hypothetical protein